MAEKVLKVLSLRFVQHLNERIMTKPRGNEHRAQTEEGHAYRSLASTNGSAWAVAGRTAYRDEFQRDYGPDLDERVDRNESVGDF